MANMTPAGLGFSTIRGSERISTLLCFDYYLNYMPDSEYLHHAWIIF